MTAYAYVNWGRWVADCPDLSCPGAEDVTPTQQAVTCDHCNRTWPMIWPPEPNRIMAVLVLRPVPSTRNWLPGETVDMLRAENVEHGVSV